MRTLRKLIPVPGLVLVLGPGRPHSAAASAPDGIAQAPAPFATPPVLAGTPDIATLVAKVRPSVVNITTVHEVKMSEGQFGMPDMPELRNLFPFFHQQGPGPMRPHGGEEGDEV